MYWGRGLLTSVKLLVKLDLVHVSEAIDGQI